MARVPLRIFLLAPSALLTDHRPHGDGLVSFGFVRELALRGHELHVAAGSTDLRDELASDLHVHSLPPVVDDNPLRARLRFMRGVRGLHRRLSSDGAFDVVHQLPPVEAGASLGLGRAQTPVVLGPYVADWVPGEDAATHQPSVASRLKRGLRAAEQLRATTVLLSNPAAAAKIVVRRGLHIHELPLGVDAETWRPGDLNGAGQDVLFLANLDTRKGIHVALDAFTQVAPTLPEARLVIAGGGAEAAAVERHIAESAFAERIERLGPLDRDRAVTAMRACAVYCLPSFGEPFGLTVLEAMACGKPVVATESGGLRFVVPARGGRKVPAGDADALARALGELLADSELRRTMGAYNRQLIEGRYAWSRVVDRLEEIYGEAIQRPRIPALGRLRR